MYVCIHIYMYKIGEGVRKYGYIIFHKLLCYYKNENKSHLEISKIIIIFDVIQ